MKTLENTVSKKSGPASDLPRLPRASAPIGVSLRNRLSLVHGLFRRPTNRFRAKVSIRFESADWLVFTADSLESLDAVLRLRHEVFIEELQGQKLPEGIEKDALDDLCDHLVIFDKKAGEVVGTYRLLSSHFFKRFYSEGEFQLCSLLGRSPEAKLELGRACIRKEYRNGSVIQLLWRGIALYMKATNARYLLGCSSLQTLDVDKMVRVSAWLKDRGALLEIDDVVPTAAYRSGKPLRFREGLGRLPEDMKNEEVPGLVMAYHLAGARFSAEPAVDLDFRCADYFTFLDREEMNPAFARRYFKE